jgi:DNA-directed RNA polymerase specialized sigma24 family protein
MQYQDVNPQLPEWAAKKAGSIVYWNLSDEDLEDMTQEASLAVWLTASRARTPGYLYVTGKNAALDWWRRQVAQVKDGRDVKTGGFCDCVSLDAAEGSRDHLEVIVDVADESDDHPLLGEERKAQVRKWLASYGPWRRKESVDRAMAVLELVVQGYNVHGIMHETGLAVSSVNQYRRGLQSALRQVVA